MSAPLQRTSFARRAVRGERLLDVPIVDAHAHLQMHTGFCVEAAPLEREVESFLRAMDATGVDRAVLFTCTAEDYTVLNDLTIAGVGRCPERLIGYAFATLDSPARAVRELERCRAAGLRGLKLVNAPGIGLAQDFLAPGWRPVWEFCAEAGWPVLVHALDLRLPRENPETTFIHAHGIEGIHRPEALAVMRDCPNCCWCTSSTMIAMGAIERAVELVGADRLIHGSDFPANNIATRLGAVLGARIGERDMRLILGGNIARLLGLEFRDSFPM